MPDVPRKQQELQVSLMGGKTDFSSKEGRNSFEEKNSAKKERKNYIYTRSWSCIFLPVWQAAGLVKDYS